MKKFLNYKGIYGEVNYYEPDKCFFGTICGTRDIILYEGATFAEFEKDFEESVDDYIEHCREHGKPLPKFEPIDEPMAGWIETKSAHGLPVPEPQVYARAVNG